MYFTMTSRSNGDGSDSAYVVYFERRVVAVFPINDPGVRDAREFATRFIDTMNGYYMRVKHELVHGEAI